MLNMHETDILWCKVEEMCVYLKAVHTFLDVHDVTAAVTGSHLKSLHYLKFQASPPQKCFKPGGNLQGRRLNFCFVI